MLDAGPRGGARGRVAWAGADPPGPPQIAAGIRGLRDRRHRVVRGEFLAVAVTLVLGEILGRRTSGPERRATGRMVVALYVGLVVANFAWLWPILVGASITAARWNAELWLPSWR